MMKKLFILFLIFNFNLVNLFAQTVAQKRAATMKIGMNLSYLDNWWNGSKEKHFSDFATKISLYPKSDKMAFSLNFDFLTKT